MGDGLGSNGFTVVNDAPCPVCHLDHGTDDEVTSRAISLAHWDGLRHAHWMKTCAWCRRVLEVADARALYCSRKCRQSAFRIRRRLETDERHGSPMRFAYADPPYPGRAKRYYGDEPTYAGDVDHAALIASLEASNYDGWALSTAADALRDILPMCPPDAHVCPWVKPIGANPQTNGLQYVWEPLIVVRGRQRRPGKRDWLCAQPARFGGELPGRKPIAFVAFLWQCLGGQPGDSLEDLFPGTGIVGRAWANLSQAALGDASARAPDDASLPLPAPASA